MQVSSAEMKNKKQKIAPPGVRIVKDYLIDSIVGSRVSPNRGSSMGIDSEQWQDGCHFLLWRLKGEIE